MVYPNTIANGGDPDGDKVMANFDYVLAQVAGGKGIKTGLTMAQLIVVAAAAPTEAFTCIPTDLDAWLLYCGKADRGPDGNGFSTILSFGAIS